MHIITNKNASVSPHKCFEKALGDRNGDFFVREMGSKSELKGEANMTTSATQARITQFKQQGTIRPHTRMVNTRCDVTTVQLAKSISEW